MDSLPKFNREKSWSQNRSSALTKEQAKRIRNTRAITTPYYQAEWKLLADACDQIGAPAFIVAERDNGISLWRTITNG